MTDDHAALLASIVESPDDDAPRLALADWLDERGEDGASARASFIRKQIADGSEETADTIAGLQMWPEVPSFTGSVTFRNGFIESVRADLQTLLEVLPAILTACPLVRDVEGRCPDCQGRGEHDTATGAACGKRVPPATVAAPARRGGGWRSSTCGRGRRGTTRSRTTPLRTTPTKRLRFFRRLSFRSWTPSWAVKARTRRTARRGFCSERGGRSPRPQRSVRRNPSVGSSPGRGRSDPLPCLGRGTVPGTCSSHEVRHELVSTEEGREED